MYWLVVLLAVWLVAAQLSGVNFDHVFDTAFAAVADLSVTATSTVKTYTPTATLTAFAPTPVTHITDILNVIDFSACPPHFLALTLGTTLYTARWHPTPLLGTSIASIDYVLPAVRKSLPSLISTIRAAEASFNIVGSHGNFSNNSGSWHNDMERNVIDWTSSSKAKVTTGTSGLLIALIAASLFLFVVAMGLVQLGLPKVLAHSKMFLPAKFWILLEHCANNEMQGKLSMLNEEISSLKRTKKTIGEDLKKLKSVKANVDTKIENLTGERYALQVEKDRLVSQMAKSSEGMITLQQKCRELEESIVAKDSEIHIIKAAEDTANKRLYDSQSHTRKQNLDLDAMKEDVKQKSKQNSQLEYQLKVSQTECSSLQDTLSKLQTEKSLLEEAKAAEEKALALAEAQVRKLQETNTKLEAKKVKGEALIQKKDAEIVELKKERAQLASELSVVRTELGDALAEGDRLRTRVAELEAELSAATQRIEDLKQDNQSLRADGDSLRQQLQDANTNHKLQMEEFKIKKSASQSGQELRKLQEQINRLLESESTWQHEKTAQMAEISQLNVLVKELSDAKAAVALVSTARQEEITRLESEVRKLTDDKTAAETASTAHEEQIKRLDSAIKKLTDGKAGAENASIAHKKENARLKSEVKKLTDDKTTAETASIAHEEEITRLRSEVETLTQKKAEWGPLRKTALEDSGRLQNQVWALEAENKSMLKAGQEQAKAEKEASDASKQQIQKLEAQVSRLQKQLPSEPSSSDIAISKLGNDSQPSSQIVETEIAEDERIAESSPEAPSQVISASDELMTSTTVTDTVASGTGPRTDIPADSVASRTGSTIDTPADLAASSPDSATYIPAKIDPDNHEDVALSSPSDKATAGSGSAQTLSNEGPVPFKLRKMKKEDPSGRPICKYFWRNGCRYGKNCKNSHDVPGSELYEYHPQSSKSSQGANIAQPSPSSAPRTEAVTPTTQLVNNGPVASQGLQLLPATNDKLTGDSRETKPSPASGSSRPSAAASKWATDDVNTTVSVPAAKDSIPKHSTLTTPSATGKLEAGNFPSRVGDAAKTSKSNTSLTSDKPAHSTATDSSPTTLISTTSHLAAPSSTIVASSGSGNIDTRVNTATNTPASKSALTSSKFASSGTTSSASTASDMTASGWSTTINGSARPSVARASSKLAPSDTAVRASAASAMNDSKWSAGNDTSATQPVVPGAPTGPKADRRAQKAPHQKRGKQGNRI
jgi:hypothetical protein